MSVVEGRRTRTLTSKVRIAAEEKDSATAATPRKRKRGRTLAEDDVAAPALAATPKGRRRGRPPGKTAAKYVSFASFAT